MASDYLLELDGIKGESKDKSKPATIEIMSFSWGVSNPGTMAGGGGGGAGKASFSDISFMTEVNAASTSLFLRCANGKPITKATLHCRKQGDTPQEYYTVTLSDCILSSFQASGSSGSDLPTESFSLNFAKIEFEYKPQKEDGTLDTAVKSGWDLKQNVKV
jgi:type VI secretion system secreted protein Hcp